MCAALLGSSSLPTAALYSSLASAPHNMLVGGSLAASHTQSGMAAVRSALLHNRFVIPVMVGLIWAASGVGTFGLGGPARMVALASAFPAFLALGLTLGNLNLKPDRDVGAALALRLVLSPALLLGASLVIHVPEAFLIQAGMATGLNTLTMSAEHGLPQSHIARCVAWSTGVVLAATCVLVALANRRRRRRRRRPSGGVVGAAGGAAGGSRRTAGRRTRRSGQRDPRATRARRTRAS